MKARIPHDYLVLLGILGIVGGVVLAFHWIAGVIVLGLCAVLAAVLAVKYR